MELLFHIVVDILSSVYLGDHSKNAHIVSDSNLGESLIVFKAHKLFQGNGCEVVRSLREYSEDVRIVSLLDDLEYL